MTKTNASVESEEAEVATLDKQTIPLEDSLALTRKALEEEKRKLVQEREALEEKERKLVQDRGALREEKRKHVRAVEEEKRKLTLNREIQQHKIAQDRKNWEAEKVDMDHARALYAKQLKAVETLEEHCNQLSLYYDQIQGQNHEIKVFKEKHGHLMQLVQLFDLPCLLDFLGGS